MALFLNALADINPMAAYGAMTPSIRDRVIPELFYQKQLLDTIRIDAKHYVYYRLADTMPITEKADKLVLRRWTPLQAHIVPLSEGIPPVSDKGAVMKYEIHADQYGRYMEFTDRIDYEAVDPIVSMYMTEYSLVAIETLDMLAREALMSNCSQYFAGEGAVGSFKDIVYKAGTTPYDGDYPDMRPTMLDLRKIVLSMKRNLVKPRSNGRYHVICSPEFQFDMIDDFYVKQFMSINQTTKTMYDDTVLCPLFGMEFYESYAVPTTGVFCDGTDFKTLEISTTGVGGVSGALSKKSAGYLTQEIYDDYINYDKNKGVTGPGSLAASTSYVPEGQFFADSGYRENATSLGGGTGITDTYSEFKVQHILVIGDKALVRTGLSGQDQVQVFVKPLGSAGVNDPINQRQSIGFKINSVGFAVVDSKSVVDYICIPSTLNQSFLDTTVRLCALEVTAAKGTTGNTVYTVADAGSLTFLYRKNPAIPAIYGQPVANGTDGFATLTSGTTNVTNAANDVIEIVQYVGGKVVARAEHVVVTADVGVSG